MSNGTARSGDLVSPLLGHGQHMAERAARGRADAHQHRGLYRLSVDMPEAVAYRRELGVEGWGNRSARRRGILGADDVTLGKANRRLVPTLDRACGYLAPVTCYECSARLYLRTDGLERAVCPSCGESPCPTCYDCSTPILTGSRCEPCGEERELVESRDRARDAYEAYCDDRGDEMRAGGAW